MNYFLYNRSPLCSFLSNICTSYGPSQILFSISGVAKWIRGWKTCGNYSSLISQCSEKNESRQLCQTQQRILIQNFIYHWKYILIFKELLTILSNSFYIKYFSYACLVYCTWLLREQIWTGQEESNLIPIFFPSSFWKILVADIIFDRYRLHF